MGCYRVDFLPCLSEFLFCSVLRFDRGRGAALTPRPLRTQCSAKHVRDTHAQTSASNHVRPVTAGIKRRNERVRQQEQSVRTQEVTTWLEEPLERSPGRSRTRQIRWLHRVQNSSTISVQRPAIREQESRIPSQVKTVPKEVRTHMPSSQPLHSFSIQDVT